MPIEIPPPSEPGMFQFTGTPMETSDLEKLIRCESDLENALISMIMNHGMENRHDLALPYLDRLVLLTADAEGKAGQYLSFGCAMEKLSLYESALAFYARAQLLEPADSDIWYFLNNNLGYCLNHFNRFAEAEHFCREAIRINPDHHNAYKNLAISMEGQGNLADAVENFILAVEKNAADPRALNHLDNMVDANPEIEVEIPDIRARVEKCRKAVTLANNIGRDLQERSVKRRKAATPAGDPGINQ